MMSVRWRLTTHRAHSHVIPIQLSSQPGCPTINPATINSSMALLNDTAKLLAPSPTTRAHTTLPARRLHHPVPCRTLLGIIPSSLALFLHSVRLHTAPCLPTPQRSPTHSVSFPFPCGAMRCTRKALWQVYRYCNQNCNRQPGPGGSPTTAATFQSSHTHQCQLGRGRGANYQQYSKKQNIMEPNQHPQCADRQGNLQSKGQLLGRPQRGNAHEHTHPRCARAHVVKGTAPAKQPLFHHSINHQSSGHNPFWMDGNFILRSKGHNAVHSISWCCHENRLQCLDATSIQLEV